MSQILPLPRTRTLAGSARHVEMWPDGALTIGRDLVDAPHRGFHASLKIALSGAFDLHLPSEQRSQRVSSVLIGPNVLHNTDARGSLVAALLIDPESEEYGSIAERLERSRGVCSLPEPLAESLRAAVQAGLDSGACFTAIWENVCAALVEPGEAARRSDPRVRRTADFLKQNFVTPPTLAELAARVNLSVSRLVHLFTESMGVSLRTYVHWLRMRDVLYAIAGGESLTLAAHRAGFSDLSHLTRKFREMFGEPPSKLMAERGQGGLNFVHRVPRASRHSATDCERIEAVLKASSPKSLRRS